MINAGDSLNLLSFIEVGEYISLDNGDIYTPILNLGSDIGNPLISLSFDSATSILTYIRKNSNIGTIDLEIPDNPIVGIDQVDEVVTFTYDDGTTETINVAGTTYAITADEIVVGTGSSIEGSGIYISDLVQSVNGESGVVTLDTSDISAVGDYQYITATQKVLLNTIERQLEALQDDIDDHIADVANPHETTVSNLDDTTITSAADTQLLQYNGSTWVNIDLSDLNLSDFTDDYPFDEVSVTELLDVTDAGSGAIITVAERALLASLGSNPWTDNTTYISATVEARTPSYKITGTTPYLDIEDSGSGVITRLSGDTNTGLFEIDVDKDSAQTDPDFHVSMQGVTVLELDDAQLDLSVPLYVDGNIYMSTDLVATQDWVTTQAYLIAEVDTLDTVVGRGATTGTAFGVSDDNGTVQFETGPSGPRVQLYNSEDTTVGLLRSYSVGGYQLTLNVGGIDIEEGGLLVGRSGDTYGITMNGSSELREFSTDGTFASNSDYAAVSEKAIKTYVDNAISGYTWFDIAIVAASTGNVNLANELEDGDTLDGVTLSTGDYVLIKDQTTLAQNGVYEIQASGAAVRATEMDGAGEFKSKAVFISGGSTHAGDTWLCTSDIVTPDTDDVVFTLINQGTVYTGGDGIDITGSTISLDISITGSQLTYTGGVFTLDDDLSTYDNTTSAFITTTGVTYANLSTNSAIGTGATQVAQGDHVHDDIYYTETEIGAIASGSSGASLVGVYDEFANSSSSNVQDVLDDLDSAITSNSGLTLSDITTNGATTSDAITASGGIFTNYIPATMGETGNNFPLGTSCYLVDAGTTDGASYPNSNGTVYTFKVSNIRMFQFFRGSGANDLENAGNYIYQRSCYNGTWTTWRRFVTEDASGDTTLLGALTTADTITTAAEGTSVNWYEAYNKHLDINPTFNSTTGVLTLNTYDDVNLTVDLSGIDADLLDGQEGTYYLSWDNFTDLPIADVTNYGAVGDGVTDDTTAVQAALTASKNVYFPPGTYICSNLSVASDGTHIFGAGTGSVIEFKSGSTGIMLDAGSYEVFIESLKLDGGTSGDYRSISSQTADRSGLGLSGSLNNIVRDLTIRGFENCGIYVNDTTTTALTYRTSIYNTNIYSCWIGIDTGLDGESYSRYYGLNLFFNRYAFKAGQGNVNLTSSNIYSNYYGLYLDGDRNNDGHSIASNLLLNHNTHPIYMVNVGQGYTFIGNQIFEGTITIDTCVGVHISNSTIDIDEWVLTGGGVNKIFNNHIRTTYTGTITRTSADDTVFFNNYYDDGSYIEDNTVLDVIYDELAELSSGLASTDEFLISDAGTFKKMDVSVLEDYMQSNLAFSNTVGTVTSIAVTGSDGIEIDSGSPITTNGTIVLGVNKTTMLSTLNVEDGADVTDVTNVTAAGALMDSEVDADIKTLSLPANTTISVFGASLIDDINASTARSTLGVDAAGTDNSTDVTLAGSYNYLTLVGQVITLGQIDLTTDVTGELPTTNVANLSGTNTGDNAVNTLYSSLVSNVTTNLSEGTATTTTVDVNSSDGTNATLVSASTTRAGLLSKAKYDEIVANTAKETNATHSGDVTGATVLTIGANKVNDTHIDWGTGTNQVSTADIPEQTNLYYTEGRVSANSDVSANTSARHAAVTISDSSEIDFTLTDQEISGSLKPGSIDESKLDTSVNASLDLADSALQNKVDVEGVLTGAITSHTHSYLPLGGGTISGTTTMAYNSATGYSHIINFNLSGGAYGLKASNTNDKLYYGPEYILTESDIYTSSDFDTDLAAADSDDLAEGSSNLYFTNSNGAITRNRQTTTATAVLTGTSRWEVEVDFDGLNEVITKKSGGGGVVINGTTYSYLEFVFANYNRAESALVYIEVTNSQVTLYGLSVNNIVHGESSTVLGVGKYQVTFNYDGAEFHMAISNVES